MPDPQEQMRQALRDVGQELSRAMDQAGRLARQAADDVAKLVGDQRVPRPRRGGDKPVELIRELGRLRDEGFISEEELAAKKDELLSRV
jgi:hypothetical protein